MFTNLIQTIKELRVWLSDFLFFRRHAFKLALAIRLANMKQRAFNKRYYVMLIETSKGDRLTSINNDEFKTFKRRGWLPKRMTHLDLEREAFYQTPIGLNNSFDSTQQQASKERYLRYAGKYMRQGRK